MADLIRDAPIGQIIRWMTGNKMLQYPEERPDFQCPQCYAEPEVAEKAQKESIASPSSTSAGFASDNPVDAEKAGLEKAEPEESPDDPDRDALERINTEQLERAETAKDLEKTDTMKSSLRRTTTIAALEHAETRADLEAAFTAASMPREPTRAIVPQRTSDGITLVDWYTTDDPENPQNWSLGKKSAASFLVCLYTLAFYMGYVFKSTTVLR